MSSITYEAVGNFFSEPVSSTRVGPADQTSPGPFFYGFTGPIDGVAGGNSTLVIEEFKDGAPVGTATLTGITTEVSDDGAAGPYTEYGAAASLQIQGEFDAYACFVTGTRILTPAGEVAVEDLAEGDSVVLLDGGTAPIVWIGRRRQRGGNVVRVRAHALGPQMPQRDLIVSHDHGLYVGGILVPAGLLVDDQAVTLEPRDDVTFWHVELDTHAILCADGAPAESFLDTGNRRQFANCPLAYDPLAHAPEPCAELVLDGERLDAIRRRLRPAVMA